MSELSLDHLKPDFTGATLASSIAARLRMAIMEGDLAPGAKLRLEDLRKQYDVSLSPLREALSRLSMDGLIEVAEQKGYRVAPVSVENFEEVTRLRMEMESLALRRSIELGDDAWEGDLVGAYHRLHKLERLRTDDSPIDAWELAHREFHNTLIGASRMPLLLKMCGTLHDLSDRYRRILLRTRTFDSGVDDEHRRIMDAALARDGEAASKLLQTHIQRTANNVMVLLQAHEERAGADMTKAPRKASGRSSRS